MPANRCPRCQIDWPMLKRHDTCALCGGPTMREQTRQAIGRDVARSLLKEAFETFYQHHDRDRQARGLASPETEGSIEAQKLITEMNDKEARSRR